MQALKHLQINAVYAKCVFTNLINYLLSTPTHILDEQHLIVVWQEK